MFQGIHTLTPRKVIPKKGYPESDTTFPFRINPPAYTTSYVDMLIYEDKPEGKVFLGSIDINPAGKLVLSQGGGKFDLTKRYAADVVLNYFFTSPSIRPSLPPKQLP